MKICVCVKQVPCKEAPIHISQDNTWISEKDSRFETNEADQYALEQALLIKDAEPAEVVVVSLGAERVAQSLKEALAKGADRAIHILEPNSHRLDPLSSANIMAQVIADQQFDVLLTGLQSDDFGYSQTGALIAHALGLSHASLVVEVHRCASGLRILRELEAGWRQRQEVSFPCSLSIQSGINKPRYASMKGILAAKKKPLQTVNAAELQLGEPEAGQITSGIYFPQRQRNTELIEGDATTAAQVLLTKLNLI